MAAVTVAQRREMGRRMKAAYDAWERRQPERGPQQHIAVLIASHLGDKPVRKDRISKWWKGGPITPRELVGFAYVMGVSVESLVVGREPGAQTAPICEQSLGLADEVARRLGETTRATPSQGGQQPRPATGSPE